MTHLRETCYAGDITTNSHHHGHNQHQPRIHHTSTGGLTMSDNAFWAIVVVCNTALAIVVWLKR